jgi:hypothetical protein
MAASVVKHLSRRHAILRTAPKLDHVGSLIFGKQLRVLCLHSNGYVSTFYTEASHAMVTQPPLKSVANSHLASFQSSTSRLLGNPESSRTYRNHRCKFNSIRASDFLKVLMRRVGEQCRGDRDPSCRISSCTAFTKVGSPLTGGFSSRAQTWGRRFFIRPSKYSHHFLQYTPRVLCAMMHLCNQNVRGFSGERQSFGVLHLQDTCVGSAICIGS